MTVEAMSGLPFQAGSAVAAAAGRTALWAMTAYMRAPLRNTAVAALVVLSSMAGSNALYRQSHHHPAPLFGSFEAATPAPKKASPVMPAERPKKLALKTSAETTGSVDATAVLPKPIGNDDVTAVQTQLKALSLFTGTVDGLFGPRTAKAIKAFEASIGRTPRGQLTPDIVALIKATTLQPAAAAPAVTVTPAPAVTAVTEAAPAAESEVAPLALVEAKPLPTPAPLVAAPTETQMQATIADEQPAEAAVPEAAAAVDDTASTGTETLAMTTPAPGVTKRTVQTIAVRATTAVSAPVAEAEQAMPDPLAPVATVGPDASTDPKIVTAIQRGLNSLGFLHGEVDGVAGEATAKAIRNFETYYNYEVTGRITAGLVNLLQQSGAVL